MTFLKNISSDHSTDKELVDAFKASGDMNLLTTLYQRYMDLVFGVCLKYFKEAERSKDAVMDIYTELIPKLRKHEVDNFKGWLHVLTRNYCLMQLRSPKQLKTSEFNPAFMHSDQIMHLNNEEPEKENNLTLLEGCIEKLVPEQKESISLFYLQNKCYNEIAGITGFDLNKVRSFIQNGKRNLKICMEGRQIKVDAEKK